MASEPDKPLFHRRRLKRLSAIFCGAALMMGIYGCDSGPKNGEERQAPVAATEPARAPIEAPHIPQPPPVVELHATLTCEDYRPAVKHESRALTQGELRLAKGLFGDDLDVRCLRLNFFPASKSVGMEVGAGQVYNVEFRGKEFSSPDYSREGRSKFGLFVNALTYLWQNQHPDLSRGDEKEIYYPLDSQYSFPDYGWRQQGNIMEDYALRFLHSTRKSRWLPHEYGGDRLDTDPFLQELVENQFPAAKAAREASANIEVRPLTAGETALIKSIFGDKLDTTQVRNNLHPEAYSDVVGTTTSATDAHFWGKKQASGDFSAEKDAERFGTFVHELTHVWQFQTNWQFTVPGDDLKDDKDPLAEYKYPLEAKYKFTDFAVEQQAAMIEDYARRFLHPSQRTYYLPMVYGADGAAAKEKLLMKTVEDQFPAAKQARLAYAARSGQAQQNAPAKIKVSMR